MICLSMYKTNQQKHLFNCYYYHFSLNQTKLFSIISPFLAFLVFTFHQLNSKFQIPNRVQESEYRRIPSTYSSSKSKKMATPTPASTANSSGTSSSSVSREGSAKTMAAEQISQAIQSTSNLLHLMLQSSPAQAQLMKLPGSLLAKTSAIKNTELVLEQMPRVISSLDAYMDNGLQSVPQLETVIQLLSNIEGCQLKSLSKVQLDQEENDPEEQPPESG